MRPHKLKVYEGKDGLWYWRCKAGNGETVDASEQGYKSKYYARDKALRSWPDTEFTYQPRQP